MSALTGAGAPDTVRTGGIEVDRAPVTNARYARFVAATGHRPPAYWPGGRCPDTLLDHPVVGVDFFDALAFAEWAEGAVPTEEEWLLATGLDEPAGYVWGAAFDPSRCNTVRGEAKGTTPVGAHPRGIAPSGCLDLCGNVWELTATAYEGDDESVVVKGGSWYDFPVHARVETRFRARIHRAGNTIGFRLVYGRPQRLPAFLDDDLVRRCVAYRRGKRRELEAEEVEPGAFGRIVEELREEATELIPALDADLGGDAAAAAEALRLFDVEEELRPAPAAAPPRVSELASRLWARMQELAHRHPRTLLSILCAAALSVLVLLLQATAAEAPAPARSPGGAIPAAPAARETERVAAAPATAPARARLDLALRELERGDAPAREEAERYLIAHPDVSEPRVRAACREHAPGLHQASLRYVLAAIEGRRGPDTPLRELASPPREGLVLFFTGLSGDVPRLIEEVRWTASAEGLPAAFVYTGAASRENFLERHADDLRGLAVHVDADGVLARRVGAEGPTAVAGLRRDGRPAFIHRGRIRRTTLAMRAAALARE